MFCPKCAAQNADDAKFCRACGADISLVPQAITGRLAERLAAEDEKGGRHRHRHGRRETPSVDNAVRQIFMGVAFLLVAFCVFFFMPGSNHWWFWMLIPAFGMLGSGIGAYLRVREDQKRLAPPAFAPASLSTPPRAGDLPPRRETEELMQPPGSVTEGTTRHLGVRAERPTKDA